MDPDKVSAIAQRAVPRNVRQVLEFLGLCGYYRRFVRDFAKLAAPMFKLVKEDQVWTWGEPQREAFESLKTALMSEPILRQPNFKLRFWLYTDASNYAIGAILSQKDDDGKEYVVAYASRLLKNAEIHYSITQKECLAVVWAIGKFRVYVSYTEFTVVTDHSALHWLLNKPDLAEQFARWAMYLQAFRFIIAYRQGVLHTNVDALSRPVLALLACKYPEYQNVTTLDVSQKALDPYEDSTLLHYLQFKRLPKGSSKKQVKRIEKLADHYQLHDNELQFRKDVTKPFQHVVPPQDKRVELIEKTHLLGHFGIQSTVNRLRSEFHWNKMVHDVTRVLKQCLVCKRNTKLPSIEHPARALPVTGLFDRVGIDLVFGLPTTSDGFVGILVITEYLSKYPFALPIKSKTAIEISEKFFNYISLFSPPKVVLSDQGTEFNNDLVDNLTKLHGIEHRVTSAYHPRTNGQTERFNKTLIISLRKHAEQNPLNWAKWLDYVLLSYRNRVHETTAFTPYEIVFGRPMNGFVDSISKLVDDHIDALEHRKLELHQQDEIVHPTVLHNIYKKQEHQKEHQDDSHTVQETELAPGTTVYVEIGGLKSKLEPINRGPYKIFGRA